MTVRVDRDTTDTSTALRKAETIIEGSRGRTIGRTYKVTDTTTPTTPGTALGTRL